MFQNCVLVGKFFLKHEVNWNTVCDAIHDLPYRNHRSVDDPVEVLNEHRPYWLNAIHQSRWTRDRFLVNWEEFVRCHVRAKVTDSEARQRVVWGQKQGC